MASFFENRGYPRSVVTNSQRRTKEISRERALGNSGRGHRVRCTDKILLILTYCTQRIRKSRKFFSRTSVFCPMTQLQRKFSTPSLCAFIGGIQVSETSWFIALCRLALMISKPHQREHFLPQTPVPHMWLHGKDGNGHQRQRRCSAKGTVRLYCGWCSLCHHVPALLQAVHWRNRSKAFGSFRGTPAFSVGFQTEPPLSWGWVPRGRTLQSP